MSLVQKFSDNKVTYIRGIDGLRALAVLAVMLFHLDFSFLPGGFSGVDVFFVISGYVVSASLAQKRTSGYFRFAIEFYARRIIRIFPTLVVCLIVTSIITTLFVPVSWLSAASERTGLFAFFGISNFALIWFNDGYFSPRTDFNAFTHTWSLGVEEQFYLIFPLIFFVWIKYRGNKYFLSSLANWILEILVILSLLYSWYETSVNPDKAFYLLPSRFWELACGALLFKLHAQKILESNTEIRARIFLLVGIILVGSGLVFSDKSSFPFPWAILPVSGTILLISGVRNKFDRKSIIQKILENPIFTYIGKISYSLYLWHWPVYVLLRWTTGLETIFEIGLSVTCTFILAIISYHYFETPIRRNTFIINRPSWQTISVGVSIVITSFLFSEFVFKSQQALSLSVTSDRQTWYPNSFPTDVNKQNQKFYGRKLFVLGDSHVGAYSTMLRKLSDEYGVEIVRYPTVSGTCGLTNLRTPCILKNGKFVEEVENMLVKMEALASPGDVVFLASLRMNRFGDQWGLLPGDITAYQLSEKAQHARNLALSETKKLIKRFEKLAIHIVIDAPKPIFKSPPFRCSDWFNKHNPVCLPGLSLQRDFLLNHRKPVMYSLSLLAADFPKLIIWDPFPILCDTNICSAFDGNKPLFFDGDHLSAHGNRILYPSFQLLIKNIWSSGKTNELLDIQNHPAGSTGLTFWADLFDAAGDNEDALAKALDNFGVSAAYAANFGASNTAVVQSLYAQLFGREADTEGLAFHVGLLNSEIVSLTAIARRMAGSATGDDAAILASRLSMADGFTEAVAGPGAAGEASTMAAAQAVLAAVNESTASATVGNAVARLAFLLAVRDGTLESGVAGMGTDPEQPD